jgi:hypothetical protein
MLPKGRLRFPLLDDSDRIICPGDVRRLAIGAEQQYSDLLAAPNQDTDEKDADNLRLYATASFERTS